MATRFISARNKNEHQGHLGTFKIANKSFEIEFCSIPEDSKIQFNLLTRTLRTPY
jgi:hypothetical protein